MLAELAEGQEQRALEGRKAPRVRENEPLGRKHRARGVHGPPTQTLPRWWLPRRSHEARPVCLQRQKPPRHDRSPGDSSQQMELAWVLSRDRPCQAG